MPGGLALEQYVDESTIGVVAILGLTYTRMYEPVQAIAAKLDQIKADTGLDIPIHVDGASRAMIAPFLRPTWSGTSDWSGALHQHVGPQVRAGVSGPGVGGVARARAHARGT